MKKAAMVAVAMVRSEAASQSQRCCGSWGSHLNHQRPEKMISEGPEKEVWWLLASAGGDEDGEGEGEGEGYDDGCGPTTLSRMATQQKRQ
jgi:hypothetical protein